MRWAAATCRWVWAPRLCPSSRGSGSGRPKGVGRLHAGTCSCSSTHIWFKYSRIFWELGYILLLFSTVAGVSEHHSFIFISSLNPPICGFQWFAVLPGTSRYQQVLAAIVVASGLQHGTELPSGGSEHKRGKKRVCVRDFWWEIHVFAWTIVRNKQLVSGRS